MRFILNITLGDILIILTFVVCDYLVVNSINKKFYHMMRILNKISSKFGIQTDGL